MYSYTKKSNNIWMEGYYNFSITQARNIFLGFYARLKTSQTRSDWCSEISLQWNRCPKLKSIYCYSSIYHLLIFCHHLIIAPISRLNVTNCFIFKYLLNHLSKSTRWSCNSYQSSCAKENIRCFGYCNTLNGTMDKYILNALYLTLDFFFFAWSTLLSVFAVVILELIRT